MIYNNKHNIGIKKNRRSYCNQIDVSINRTRLEYKKGIMTNNGVTLIASTRKEYINDEYIPDIINQEICEDSNEDINEDTVLWFIFDGINKLFLILAFDFAGTNDQNNINGEYNTDNKNIKEPKEEPKENAKKQLEIQCRDCTKKELNIIPKDNEVAKKENIFK